MNTGKLLLTVCVAACLASRGEPALANQVPGATITGHLTATATGDWVSIDGKSYRIKSGSPAAGEVLKLTPGQYVDVQLNGPANTAASEVINIVPHSGP